MTKVYFFAPLIALLVFSGVYTYSQSGHKEREQARQTQLKIEREAKLTAEKEARRVALEEGMRLQEQRKKERLEREAREAAERESRQQALDIRDKAYRDQERLGRQIERMKRETAMELEILKKLQGEKEIMLSEQAFLKAFVPQAQASAAELESVLDKIASAEAARVKQAAEDAKKKS